MGYINDLPNAVDKSFVDGIINKSDETMIYINVCGPFNSELEEALNAIYFDNTREFELIQIKRLDKFMGALIAMKHKTAPKQTF